MKLKSAVLLVGLLAATPAGAASINPSVPRGMTMHSVPDASLPYEKMSSRELNQLCRMRQICLPEWVAHDSRFLHMIRHPHAHAITKPLGVMQGVRMDPLNGDMSNATSSNWSGSVWPTQNGFPGQPSGSETVPYPSSYDGGTDLISVWSGMGGAFDGDLPLNQAGWVADTDGSVLGGSGGPAVVTFYECYPQGAVGFNYENVGDYIYHAVWTDFYGSGWFFVGDFSNGDIAYGSAPCNVTYPQSVEDILEAPSVGGQVATLANYGSMTMNNALAGYDSSGNPLYPFGDSNAIFVTMIQNGVTASTAYGLDETDLQFDSYP